MNGDLIANNFTANVDGKLIRKILLFTKLILALSILYAVIELYNWYIVLQSTSGREFGRRIDIYNYRVYSAVMFVLLAAGIIGHVFNVRAFRFISNALEDNDAGLFNKGCAYTYTVARLAAASFGIAILNAIIRLLLKQ